MADYATRKPGASGESEARPQARAAGPAYYLDAPLGVFGGPVSLVPAAGAGGGHALPDDVLARMQQAFGADLSAVRIHEDASADAAGAQAYTLGTDIHFAPGKYDPTSASGLELLGHEIAHVVQQAEGRVAPTSEHAHVGAMNTDASLEREADEAGARAARGESARAPSSLSAATPIVQRKVNAVPSMRNTRLELLGDGTPTHHGLTIPEFATYILEQADWFAELSLTQSDRDALWKIVHVLHSGPHVVTACANLHVGEVAALPTRRVLASYADGFDSKKQTVQLVTPAPILRHALQQGQAMQDLETFVPAPVRRHIIPEAGLDYLMRDRKIGDLEAYYNLFRPTLEQPGEWTHVEALLRDGVMRWAPLLGWVSELHVLNLFTRALLLGNIQDTSRSRPVLLFLMSALDWNGALLQQDRLGTVLADKHNLGLVVQGRTLSGVTSQVSRVARDYGVGGRLGQVALGGHGSDTSMEMASDAKSGQWDPLYNSVSYDGQANIDSNDPKANGTEALIDTIIGSLDPATANIVFVGCLINSHNVDAGAPGLTGKAAVVQAELGRRLKAHPNLVDYMHKRIEASGRSVSVSSANASTIFKSFSIDGAGKAQLKLDADPDIGGSKLDYLRTGGEPQGALRAAIECCGDPAIGIEATEKEVRKRAAALRASTDLSETCIRLAFAFALGTPNGLDVAKLVDVSKRVHVWDMLTEYTGEGLASTVHPSEARRVFSTLLACNIDDNVRAQIHHAWMKYEPAHAMQMMSALSTSKLTVDTFAPHLSRSIVDPYLAAMLPVRGTPTRGQMLLALAIADMDGTVPATVRNFLRHAAGGAASRSFPAARDVKTLLPNGEGRILEKIGLSDSAPRGSADAVNGNADLDADGTNETMISVDSRKALLADDAVVRETASSTAVVVGVLAKGAQIGVTGTVSDGTWSAVDFGGRVRFIETALLEQENQ